MADSNPIKLCECGCGLPTPIAKRHYPKFGHVLGHPVRFIQGHHTYRHGHGRASDGQSTPTYRSWAGMKSRCTNPKDGRFSDYGGRGIRVCDRWLHSFESFLADMGERPPGTSIDRYPNNDGNYEPGNCRWATFKEQENNRRNNRLLTFSGKTQTLQQWADEVAIGATTIDARIKRGWSIDRAFTTPVRTARLYEYDRQKHSLAEWARILGVRKARLDDRLIAGWSIERALSTPRGPTGPK